MNSKVFSWAAGKIVALVVSRSGPGAPTPRSKAAAALLDQAIYDGKERNSERVCNLYGSKSRVFLADHAYDRAKATQVAGKTLAFAADTGALLVRLEARHG